MKTAVLIPVYKEDPEALTQVVQRIRVNHPQGRVVIVDDGNQNAALVEAIHRAADEVVTHEVNRGYTQSMRDGLTAALALGANAVVKLDADGQYFPERIPQLLCMLRGHDIVSASRYHPDSMEVNRYPEREEISRWVAQEIRERFGVTITDPFCGFRAFSRRAIERLLPMLGEWINQWGYGLSLEITLKTIALGLRMAEVGAELYYPTLKHFPGSMQTPEFRRNYYYSFFVRAEALAEEKCQGAAVARK